MYGPTTHYQFIGGGAGDWIVRSLSVAAGEGLACPTRLMVRTGTAPVPEGAAWCLGGVTSNLRYTIRDEAQALAERSNMTGRPEARHAALIPISKCAQWWAMAQDERRAVFEEVSRHTSLSLPYLPRIARRLHHGRDLGEPFDFLTWFEFAPEHEPAFDELLGLLRASREWDYVEREVDIRLVREA
jgi:hypothetical protein